MRLDNRNKNKRAQILLFVFFMLLLSGILTIGLHNMWQSEIQNTMQEREGIKAFYIAQAGIEYAKMRLAQLETWPGGTFAFVGGGIFEIIVVPISNVCPPEPYSTCNEISSRGIFKIAVTSIACAPPNVTCKEIFCIGKILNKEISSTGVLNEADQTIADRRIKVKVCLDQNPGNPPPNVVGDEEQLEWSWQEF